MESDYILVCILRVVRKFNDAKVTFSLFPPLNVRNQILVTERNRYNHCAVYVSCGVFGWGSGIKEESGLNDNKFPLGLKCPKFICEFNFDLLNLVYTKILLTFMLWISSIFSSQIMNICSGFWILTLCPVFSVATNRFSLFLCNQYVSGQ